MTVISKKRYIRCNTKEYFDSFKENTLIHKIGPNMGICITFFFYASVLSSCLHQTLTGFVFW